MGRMYSASFSAVAVTASQDLFEVTSPADAVTRIHSIVLGQHTEIGDAQDEMLQIALKRGATATGTAGTQGATPPPLSFGDAAYGGVVDLNNTAKASGGTIVTLHSDAFNVRAGWMYRPTPEERIDLSPSQRFTVELVSTPTDSITMDGTIIFEEIGG